MSETVVVIYPEDEVEHRNSKSGNELTFFRAWLSGIAPSPLPVRLMAGGTHNIPSGEVSVDLLEFVRVRDERLEVDNFKLSDHLIMELGKRPVPKRAAQ